MRRAATGIVVGLVAMLGAGGAAHAGFAPGNEAIGAAEQFSLWDIEADADGTAVVAWRAIDRAGNRSSARRLKFRFGRRR